LIEFKRIYDFIKYQMKYEAQSVGRFEFELAVVWDVGETVKS